MSLRTISGAGDTDPGPDGQAVAVEHAASRLRERLYGAISGLATLAVLSRYTSADTNAWTRVLDVAVATGGLWAASLLADWVALPKTPILVSGVPSRDPGMPRIG
jgi:hypothetical protein